LKALVIGGDALIGRALSTALERMEANVVRTTRRVARAEGWLHLDLALPLPTLPTFDVAFFCAAMTRFADCRTMPQLAELVNVQAPVELAERMVDRGSRVIFLSTSAVLDCKQPRMRADQPYSPRGAYGAQKAEAERAFLAFGPRATVLRLSKVLTPADARIGKWTRDMRAGRAVHAFDDHRISPVAEEQVVTALLAVADKGEGGIYQVSARDDVSYADLARCVARRIGADESLVQACPASRGGIPADEVTAYTSLDTSRLEQLCGYAPSAATEILERMLP
jgi:dTDP-4-dehydrorhamnose reductase